LHQAEFVSPTITYFGSNLSEWMPALQADGVKVSILERENGKSGVIEFTDLNGQRIVLKAQAPVSRQNVAFEMMTPAGPQTKDKHYSKLGMFGEFSIPTKDRAASAAFWEKLGFKKMHESNSPYPWGIYVDGLTVRGLHQTTEFKAPALPFFSQRFKRTHHHFEKRRLLIHGRSRSHQLRHAISRRPDDFCVQFALNSTSCSKASRKDFFFAESWRDGFYFSDSKQNKNSLTLPRPLLFLNLTFRCKFRK
jgi:hypothetical protein